MAVEVDSLHGRLCASDARTVQHASASTAAQNHFVMLRAGWVLKWEPGRDGGRFIQMKQESSRK